MQRGMAESVDMKPYFAGERLYGDDFNASEIAAWFADEAEGYFDLAHDGVGEYAYAYHALNLRHGFALLPPRRFDHVVGLGAAYGDELRPVVSRAGAITIVEPADGFARSDVAGVPVTYRKPLPSGLLPLADASTDLLVCLGVLHHIPNVGAVVRDFGRVLRPGGFVLLREPTISMGDWRRPRRGLTRRERGIPLAILRAMIGAAGLRIVSERRVMFSLSSRLSWLLKGPVYNSAWVVALDAAICRFPFWSNAYHATNLFQKLRPTSVFYVLQKGHAA